LELVSIFMTKIWQLLTEEKIKALSEDDLKSYLLWLEEEKTSKQNDLSTRKAILNKLVAPQKKESLNKKRAEEKEELARVRQELNNT